MNAIASEDASEEVDFVSLVRTLWNGKWLIVSLTMIGTLGGVLYALAQPDVFRAEALVQPRQASQALGGLGALAAQVSGISGLGVSLGGGTDRDVALATLRSRTVVEKFIEDLKLLPILYESEWDEQAHTWVSSDPKSIPTAWQAYNDFTTDILKISENRNTGLVTVAIEWRNPEEAQRWVTELIARTNAHLKERAIQEGE